MNKRPEVIHRDNWVTMTKGGNGLMSELLEKAKKLKKAAKKLGYTQLQRRKTSALAKMADHIFRREKEFILAENAKDIQAGKREWLTLFSY